MSDWLMEAYASLEGLTFRRYVHEDEANGANDSDESDEDNNENNETITNLQASFQTRITIRYATNASTTKATSLPISQSKIPKIIEREIGEVKAQMQALRAEIEAAVESIDDGDDDNDNDNDDGDEIIEEDEEMQECNHEQNLDDGDGAATKEIVEVDEDWLLLNNVDDNDDVDDDVMEKSETGEYDVMEDEN
ncbi:unnamed protein product [Aureobasidium pullulans]|nr:unnamed protein product [Aureobasidium pullulans]